MIYFIREPLTKRVKIGLSDAPWARFAQIQTGCPTDLEMAAIVSGGADEEAAFHVRFSEQRVRGEWFAATGSLAAFLASQPAPLKVRACERREPKTPLDGWLIANRVQSFDLATRLGCCASLVSHFRTGLREPSLAMAVHLMEITGLEARDFLYAGRREASTSEAA